MYKNIVYQYEKIVLQIYLAASFFIIYHVHGPRYCGHKLLYCSKSVYVIR